MIEWFILFILPSEKMDYYENVQTFINVTTVLPPGGQHFRSHNRRCNSRTPLIRPPSESHWCGRIRGMVAREGFI